MAVDPVSGFGRRLREHQIAAGLSQNQLARLAGIDPAYVNQIVKHRRGSPSRPVVVALAEALGLDTWETDRLLFEAGYAPEHDWQAIALDYAQRLKRLDRVFVGMAELPARCRVVEESA